MSWGDRMPLVDRKRAHAAQQRTLAAGRRDAATVENVRRLLDVHPIMVPAELLILALTDPNRCALCASAYASCPAHVA